MYYTFSMPAHKKPDDAKATHAVSARLTAPEETRLAAILAEVSATWDAAGLPAEATFTAWLRWVIRRWALGAPQGTPLLGPYGAAPPLPPPLPARDTVRAAFAALGEEDRRAILDAFGAAPADTPVEGPKLDAVLSLGDGDRVAFFEALALTLSPVSCAVAFLASLDKAGERGDDDAHGAAIDILRARFPGMMERSPDVAVRVLGALEGEARAAALVALREALPELRPVPAAPVAEDVEGLARAFLSALAVRVEADPKGHLDSEDPAFIVAALARLRDGSAIEALSDTAVYDAHEHAKRTVKAPKKPAKPSPASPPARKGDSLSEACAALPGHSKRVRSDPALRKETIEGWVKELSARFHVSGDTVRNALEAARAADRSKGWRRTDIFPGESEA